jgi:C_GCAxxG_C_C family probable redox protein
MLTVGEVYLEKLQEREKRIASAFAGGCGGTMKDQCGAYSAGVIIIGALLGRTRSKEDSQLCEQAVQEYRKRFLQKMDFLLCGELRKEKYGEDNEIPCSTLVSDAVIELMAVLDSERYADVQ